MLDPITLDQLRTLIAVAEAGSFSAAARQLQRVQSAVSTAMANLEQQLDVQLWDRSTRIPSLTEQGRAVLAAARRVTSEVDSLRGLAAGLHSGLEATVSLCVDQLLPIDALLALCSEFAREFPSVDLRVDTQTLSAVSARVLSGAATIGVASAAGIAHGLQQRVLARIKLVPVVAADHPLAQARGPLPSARLGDCVQIVLSERNEQGVSDQAVISPRTWRIADLHTKHAMLKAGLGWGNLPEHLIADDLRHGRLKRLRLQAWAEDEHVLSLSAIYRSEAGFGPAHRWVLDKLEELCRALPGKRRPAR